MPSPDTPLTAPEVRVLGSLIEKEITVPDAYPLSLNALVNACNQTSNRDPVVSYDENTVADAVRHLRERALVRAVHKADARVPKFQHLVNEKLNLDGRGLAVMCVLMLRGPQTPGELRTRGARLYDFPSVEEVDATLAMLMKREPSLVVRLPRRAGQKEVRYAHMLAGEVAAEGPEVMAAVRVEPDVDRIAALEETVGELRREIADLRTQLDQFRKAFE
jgi:uncharacterized protein YceH (UPF0502 family)